MKENFPFAEKNSQFELNINFVFFLWYRINFILGIFTQWVEFKQHAYIRGFGTGTYKL